MLFQRNEGLTLAVAWPAFALEDLGSRAWGRVWVVLGQSGQAADQKAAQKRWDHSQPDDRGSSGQQTLRGRGESWSWGSWQRAESGARSDIELDADGLAVCSGFERHPDRVGIRISGKAAAHFPSAAAMRSSPGATRPEQQRVDRAAHQKGAK